MKSSSKKVTIRDIAKASGVSTSTVGYILSGDQKYKFKEQTRKLVHKIAAELNYRPNIAAKALSKQKQFVVGVLMLGRGNFYSLLSVNIQRELVKHNYIGLFFYWETTKDMEKGIDYLVSRNVDGIISLEYSKAFSKENIPVAIYGQNLKNVNCVSMDYNYSVSKALTYLQGLGHEKVAFIGNLNTQKYSIFKSLSKQMGMYSAPEWQLEANLNNIKAATTRLLSSKDRPTAIICAADVLALYVISIAVQAGFDIPGDISIIGSDNLPESAYYNPPLTTFEINIKNISKKLVELLIGEIDAPDRPRQEVILKPELIIRKSCALKK